MAVTDEKLSLHVLRRRDTLRNAIVARRAGQPRRLKQLITTTESLLQEVASVYTWGRSSSFPRSSLGHNEHGGAHYVEPISPHPSPLEGVCCREGLFPFSLRSCQSRGA